MLEVGSCTVYIGSWILNIESWTNTPASDNIRIVFAFIPDPPNQVPWYVDTAVLSCLGVRVWCRLIAVFVYFLRACAPCRLHVIYRDTTEVTANARPIERPIQNSVDAYLQRLILR